VRVRGARRPLRVPLTDASLEVEDATTVVVRFTLPPGSFATVVLAELMKDRDAGDDVPEEGPDVPEEVEDDDAATDVATEA
jgi:tRNA(Glu) U13 pseudouridine synthase TruD